MDAGWNSAGVGGSGSNSSCYVSDSDNAGGAISDFTGSSAAERDVREFVGVDETFVSSGCFVFVDDGGDAVVVDSDLGGVAGVSGGV